MKRSIVLVVLSLLSRISFSQSIAASNFNYWYDPSNEVELQLRPIRSVDKIIVRYTLLARRGGPEKYSITWEKRPSYVETTGTPVTEKDSVLSVTEKTKRGFLSFELTDKPWLLLAHLGNSGS